MRLTASISTLVVIVAVLAMMLHSCHGLIRRCFACRSRGDKGDCKDPFKVNQTLVIEDHEYQRQVGIKAIPCASGWCGKVIDGGAGKDDFDQATERICIQRPPTDGEERCADTVFGSHRKVFMCFCRGDLCNSAPDSVQTWSRVLGVSLVAAFMPLLFRIGA